MSRTIWSRTRDRSPGRHSLVPSVRSCRRAVAASGGAGGGCCVWPTPQAAPSSTLVPKRSLGTGECPTRQASRQWASRKRSSTLTTSRRVLAWAGDLRNPSANLSSTASCPMPRKGARPTFCFGPQAERISKGALESASGSGEPPAVVTVLDGLINGSSAAGLRLSASRADLCKRAGAPHPRRTSPFRQAPILCVCPCPRSSSALVPARQSTPSSGEPDEVVV